MLDPAAWFLIRLLLIVLGVTVGLYLLHRLALRLEEAGYLYHRNQQSSGGGATPVFGEPDKLVRPSIEHTIETQGEQTIVRERGGE